MSQILPIAQPTLVRNGSLFLNRLEPRVRWKGRQTLVGRVGVGEITIDTSKQMSWARLGAQREIPLLCFILILQWEARFGQVGLITTGPTNRIGPSAAVG